MSEASVITLDPVDVPSAGVGVLADWVSILGTLDRELSDAERVDRIRVLEEIKAAACAAQARVTADLDASQREHHAALGIRAADQGKGVAAQVGLARRESPNRGAVHLGLAKVLVTEMPHTMAALESGRLSEWRATLLVRETACLTLADRQTVDRVLVADPAVLDGKGDQALVAEIKKLAYTLDPHAVVARARKAESERRVTCRPAPDTMAYLSALLPVTAGVACYAALCHAADTARAAGDPRSRGQVMADTLVERITGQATAPAVGVEIGLVMTDTTLLGGDSTPAKVPGYGPVPAALARDWISDPAARVWIRRLYTHPDTGNLVAMDSHRRVFEGNLRRFLLTRDQHCRTPWCDAPIRHLDHIRAHHAGGHTTASNGQGLCEHCNHTKTAPGWRARPRPGPRHTVTITTPTGHSYRSTAPPPPGTPRGTPTRETVPAPAKLNSLEQRFRDYILGA